MSMVPCLEHKEIFDRVYENIIAPKEYRDTMTWWEKLKEGNSFWDKFPFTQVWRKFRKMHRECSECKGF